MLSPLLQMAPIDDFNYYTFCTFTKFAEKVANACSNYNSRMAGGNPIALSDGMAFQNAAAAAKDTILHFNILAEPGDFFNPQCYTDILVCQGDFQAASALPDNTLYFPDSPNSIIRGMLYSIAWAYDYLIGYTKSEGAPAYLTGFYNYVNIFYGLLENNTTIELPGEVIPNPFPFPPNYKPPVAQTISSLTSDTFVAFTNIASTFATQFANDIDKINFVQVADKELLLTEISIAERVAAQNLCRAAATAAIMAQKDITPTNFQFPSLINAQTSFKDVLNLSKAYFLDNETRTPILDDIITAFSYAYNFDSPNFVVVVNDLYKYVL